MKKKKAFVDVDNVICIPGYLYFINKFLTASYRIDDFKEYIKEKEVMDEDALKEFNEYLKYQNIYEHAIIIPNAIETLEKYRDDYDFYIASSCINPNMVEDSGMLFSYKYDYLISILPFIHPSKFIFLNDKNVLNGYLQIDDDINQMKNNNPLKILYPANFNLGISGKELKNKGIIRAGFDWQTGWDEIDKILDKDKSKKLVKIK